MKIDPDTRISVLLKENKACIEAIASLSKPLEKLRNPILRKIMASRVTIAEAAKIGGVQLEDFANVLCPLGFEFKNTTIPMDLTKEKPLWLEQLPSQHLEIFDVRSLLAKGDDPLKQIVQRFKEVKPGFGLCIINTFIPIPLVRLLEKGDVKSYTETINESEYRTYFLKPIGSKGSTSQSKEQKVFFIGEHEFANLCAGFEKEQIQEINVMDLEMPLPMQTILQGLPTLINGHALYVHHKKVPLYLLEELADQDYKIYVWNIEEGKVKLLIFRISGNE